MTWLAYSVVIFVTSLAGFGGFAWLTRELRIPLARLTDLDRPLPCDLIRGPGIAAYGPFPADPGPLTDSELAVAGEALVRDTHAMCEARSREVDAMIARAGELGMTR